MKYVLDACALIAFLDKEEGWEPVRDLLLQAAGGKIDVFMNVFNFWEVYYDKLKKAPEYGGLFLSQFDDLPVQLIEYKRDEICYTAGELKAAYNRMTAADAIGLASAKCIQGTFVTCDHAELDKYEALLGIPFLWIRPQKPKQEKARKIVVQSIVDVDAEKAVHLDIALPADSSPGIYRAVVTL